MARKIVKFLGKQMKIFALVLIAAVALNGNTAFAFDAQGSGKLSNGNCNCKDNCDRFAKAGQLAGAQLAQCKSDCQQKFAGCNKGSQR
jgi:hypothetical protein